MDKLIILLLRAASIGCKFILLFVIARLLSTSDVGIYGLATSFINIAILFVGLDYYTFAQRQLSQGKNTCLIITNQMALYLVLYLVSFIFIAVFCGLEYLPIRYLILLFLVLVIEHINQEVSRYLIYNEKQKVVSVLLFIRSGFWAILYAAFLYLTDYKDVILLFYFWLFGITLSLLISISHLNNEIKFKPSLVLKSHIIKGVTSALPIFFAGISFKLIFFLDRFLLKSISDDETVGIYVFYITLTMSILGFLEPLLFSFYYQRLLKFFNQNKFQQFGLTLKKLIFSTLAMSLVINIGIFFISEYVVSITGNEIFIENYSLVNYIYFIVIFYTISLMAHYVLYSINLDKIIFKSHITALLVYVLSFYFLELMHSSFALELKPIDIVFISMILSLCWMMLTSILPIFLYRKLFCRKN
ncbi:oligosaccharide flippase family protein [Photorhabdus sp. RM323S]|uniref:oligosaccharide flippase family protein n=1 Tax=Photorhabdus sp. RM323S TaxID=3342828 RepID=UPI0036DEE304